MSMCVYIVYASFHVKMSIFPTFRQKETLNRPAPYAWNAHYSLQKQYQSSTNTHVDVTWQCCGFGHRLHFHADTYKAALQNMHALLIVWPMRDANCFFNGSRVTDLFRELFAFKNMGVDFQHRQHIQSGDIVSLHPKHVFEWSDYDSLQNRTKRRLTPITNDQIMSDPAIRRFYLQIAENMNQRIRSAVSQFVQTQHIDTSRLITVHIRQGNNETGHFVNEQRKDNVSDIVNSVHRQIEHIVKESNQSDWKVFVATDNYETVTLLKAKSNNVVLTRNQLRPNQGVLFGEWMHDRPEERCVEAAMDSLIDMQLLSLGKVFLIPAYSSFNYLPQVVVSERGDIICVADPEWTCKSGSGMEESGV